jgi:glucokinase
MAETEYFDFLKTINRRRVMESIRQKQPISRSQLARDLGLSKPTVCLIVEELLNKQILKAVGWKNPTKSGGRPAKLVSINDESAYCIGIDIGGTKILLIITDLAGNIFYETKLPTTNKAEEIIKIITDSIAASGIAKEMFIGIGIGAPGRVLNCGESVSTSVRALKWTKFNLKSSLEQGLGIPVFVENDINAAALGEQWKGAGRGCSDFFLIAIGTGLGSAMIAEGNLIRGINNHAGEIGQFLDRQDVASGLYNIKGQQGILESRLSGTGLGSHGCGSEELFKRYSLGDAEAVQVIGDFINELSIIISNCISLLNPQRVLLGGGVSNDLKPFLPKINKLVDHLTNMKAEIKLADLGPKAGAYGAVAFLLKQLEAV